MKPTRLTILIIIFISFFSFPTQAASPDDVVINEIAWMGTTVSHADEWIELYNNTDSEIILDGWALKSTDDTPTINLEGVLLANSFFLLERTDDTTIVGTTADQIYTGAVGNSGEHLKLLDADGNLIDEIDASSGWPAGDNSTKQTMELKNTKLSSRVLDNWATSLNPGGTPGAQNSIYEPTTPSPPDPESDPVPDQSPPADELNTTTTPSQSPPNPEEEVGVATTTNNGEEAPEQMIYPDNIFINEIMPSPEGSDSEQEWIELINTNDEQVDISSWQIRDTIGAINTYTFPEGAVLGANAYLVLSRPTTKITLNNDGDGLELVRPDEEIVQSVEYSKAPKGKSYSKEDPAKSAAADHGASWQWSDVPTPGSANILRTTAYSPPTTDYRLQQTANSLHQTSNSEQAAVEGGQEAVSGELSAVSSSQQLASIAPTKTINTSGQSTGMLVYIIAPLLALLSAIFIFLLKKRLQRP